MAPCAHGMTCVHMHISSYFGQASLPGPAAECEPTSASVLSECIICFSAGNCAASSMSVLFRSRRSAHLHAQISTATESVQLCFLTVTYGK